MAITVKFFARLREQFNQDEYSLTQNDLKDVGDVWYACTQHDEIPTDVFCAVNLEHADFNNPVHDGDEVAFFPRVSGG